MKYTISAYIGLAVIISMLTSCQDKQDYQMNEADYLRQIRMIASDFSYSDISTRTAFQITDKGAEFSWSSNDTVGIFPETGAQAYFPMTQGAGTKNAIFTGGGWALKEASRYAAYYPFVGNYYLDRRRIPIQYAGQIQIGNASTSHLSQYDYMVASADAPINGNVDFRFEHLGCLVQLKLKCPHLKDLMDITFSSTDDDFVSAGYVDLLKDGDVAVIEPLYRTNSISLGLKEISAADENEMIVLYWMMAPIDLSGKTIRAKMSDTSGRVQEFTLTGKNFCAGKAYSFSADLSNEDFRDASIHVVKAGTLSLYISEHQKYSMTDLKLSGELNGTDIRFIREMAGRDVNGSETAGSLSNLDLEDVRIVAGGEHYLHRVSQSTGVDYVTRDSVLGYYMFNDCAKLQKVRLGNSIKSIAYSAFQGCAGLQTVSLGNGIKSIEHSAFRGCTGLTDIEFGDQIICIGEYAFCDCISLESISIPDNVIELYDGAFQGCSHLTSVRLPVNLQYISWNLFMNCTNLQSLYVPDGVRGIWNAAFAGCENLSSINIPEGVTQIGPRAFWGCRNLKTIVLPNSLKYIYEYAFYDSGLTEVLIPKNVSYLGSYAFAVCGPVSSLTISGNIEEVGSFPYPVGCKCLILSEDVSVIIKDLFVYIHFPEIHCRSTVPPVVYTPNFNSTDKSKSVLYVPVGSAEAYKNAAVWEDFENIVEEE